MEMIVAVMAVVVVALVLTGDVGVGEDYCVVIELATVVRAVVMAGFLVMGA